MSAVGASKPGEPVERLSSGVIFREGTLDGLPHPGAGREPAALGGLVDPAIERLGHQDLETNTHALILP